MEKLFCWRIMRRLCLSLRNHLLYHLSRTSWNFISYHIFCLDGCYFSWFRSHDRDCWIYIMFSLYSANLLLHKGMRYICLKSGLTLIPLFFRLTDSSLFWRSRSIVDSSIVFLNLFESFEVLYTLSSTVSIINTQILSKPFLRHRQ